MTRTTCLVVAALVLAGCSKPPLSSQTAARAIREAAHFREPGSIGVARREAPSDCKTKLDEDADWRALAKVGWLEVGKEDDFERATEGQPAVKCVGTLSGDGLRAGAALNTTTYQDWRVPAATRELVAIQSITSTENDISTVQFSYRWRLNAFGSQILDPGPELVGTAILRLLDNGWQVADFTALPEFAPARLPAGPGPTPAP
jgi:hypothetical protein